MSKPNEAQRQWLEQVLGVLGGGGGPTSALRSDPVTGESSEGPISATMGEQSVPRADGAQGTLKLLQAGKAAANWFVPKLEITGGPKRELAIAGKLTVELKVSNWDKRPRGTMLHWSVTGSVKAVDFVHEQFDGGGTLTVTGLAAGTDFDLREQTGSSP